MWCFDSLFLVVNTSAIDCLERLISKMTYYVLNGMLDPIYSLTSRWLKSHTLVTLDVGYMEVSKVSAEC